MRPTRATCGARHPQPKTVAPSPPIDTGCASAWLRADDDRLAGEGGRRDGRVVDDAVDDHVDDVVVELDGIGRDPRQLPGELALAGQVLVTPVGAQVVGLHAPTLSKCG